MQNSDQEPDNGNVLTVGGWIIAAAAGVLVYWLLDFQLGYYLISALAFGAAIGLIVLLVLLIAVSRTEPIAPPSRVRKIVPTPERAVPAPVAASPVAAAVVAPGRVTAARAAAGQVEVPAKAVAPAAADPLTTITPLFDTPAEAKAAPAVPKAKAAAKDKPAPKAKPAAKPKAASPKASTAATGPVRLKAARKGGADDLKEIEGVGPALEKLLNSLGFYHFDQISGWTDADIAIVDTEMKTFKGRIARDRWVAQARIIATDGLDAFRERAKTNNY